MNCIMHKIILFSVLMTFSFHIQASAQEYTLKNKFEEGEVKYLNSIVIMDGQTKMGDATLPLNSTTDMGMIFRTKSVSAENVATIEMEIEKFLMENAMFGNTKIDALKMLNIGEQKIEVQVNSSGESTGTEDFSKLGIANLGDQTKNTSMQMPWPKLPKEPVNVGDTWFEEQVVQLGESSKPIIKSITYTLSEINEQDGDRIAMITTKSMINAENVQMTKEVPQPGAAQSSVDFNYTFREYIGDGNGTMKFNIDEGELISVSETIDMTIDMGGEANVNQAGFPSNYRMEYEVKTESQFLDEVPSE